MNDFKLRIKVIATVHEMLYESENLKSINFSDYVKKLCSNISLISNVDKKVSFNIDIKDVYIKLNTSIPLGLLINECVTNSIKHGFKDRESGEIVISFQKLKNENYQMIISDDGIGYKDELFNKKHNTLGLKLIQNLTIQFRSDIKKLNTSKGTCYEITFYKFEMD